MTNQEKIEQLEETVNELVMLQSSMAREFIEFAAIIKSFPALLNQQTIINTMTDKRLTILEGSNNATTNYH